MIRSGSDEAVKPRVLVVGNYLADRQYSMLAYEKAVISALEGLERVELGQWRPEPPRGQGRRRRSRLMAGVDKFILPFVAAPAAEVALIIDQSNALYAFGFRARKVLIICHDLVPVLYASGELPGWRPSFVRNVLTWLNLRALERADHVICVSEATRQDLMRLTRVSEARCSTLLNARSALMDAAVAEAPAGAPEPSSAAPYILCFGGWLTKNAAASVRIFASAASRLSPGARLKMVGDFAGLAAAEAARSGVSHRLEVLRDVSDADLAALYRNAEALLFPSIYEGFGWPVLEAQACGLPVVCSTSGSLPEVAGEGACLAPLSDEAALSEALVRVVTDRSFRAALVERGTRNLQRFDPDLWAQALRRRVASLLG